MVLEYFTLKRGDKKREEIQKTPVLNEQDEEFLKRIASDEEPAPPLPARTVILDPNPTKGKDAQVALMDGAEKIELPASPPEVAEEVEDDASPVSASSPKDEKSKDKKKSNYWSYIPSIPGRMKSIAKRKESVKSKDKGKGKEKEQEAKKDDKTIDPTSSASETQATTDLNPDPNMPTTEAQKEEDDLTSILDQLNLAAVNNRVFSFSKESQELMDKFKLVLKDIINGAPTAYDDLEQLLKGSDKQLKRMYGAMPPFLQSLVKSLPTKIGTSLAPEVMAAMSEKPGADGARLMAEGGGVSAAGKKKKRSYPPSLKKLVSQQGAVAGMLKSILNFLKLRFPAFITGTNVLMSLAVFLLLFVFWYCHKRGRETRLEKERLDAEASGESGISDLEDSTILTPEPASSASASFVKNAEPPITINEEASAEEQPSAAVADLPSVLDLPEPSSVPLPVQSPGTEKDLAEGVDVKKV